MPTLSSCDATLLKLETYISTCGSEKVTIGPTAGGIRLPLYYVDDDLSPFVPRTRCVIQVLWHPRSGQRPPVASFDIFRPQEIQQAAIRVRDQCVKGNQFHGPQLGKEWILTRQWVLVLFGTALVGGGVSGNGTMSVVWADGTNRTVNASVFGNSIGCGSSKGLLGNGLGLNIENDSGVKITESS